MGRCQATRRSVNPRARFPTFLPGFRPSGATFQRIEVTPGTADPQIEEADCQGVPGGAALIDSCGVCDDDPGDDCDCEGIPGGLARLDACGTCDGDLSNDCVATDGALTITFTSVNAEGPYAPRNIGAV